MTVCILAEPEDPVPSFVALKAEQRGHDVLWLSESQLGVTWSFSVDDTDPQSGYLVYNDRQHSFSELSGAYVNLNPRPALPFGIELDPEDMDTFMGSRRFTIRRLTDLLPVPTANRLRAGRSNNSKGYQMAALDQGGFLVPDWVISNVPNVVDDFSGVYHGQVVCKSISGLRSRVQMYDATMKDRLVNGTTPIIAQQRIVGTDVRVHTVGGLAFATEIRAASGVDYRFDGGEQKYSAVSVPADVESRCHAFAEQEGMVIAGFDFVVTEDGQWYCLEMNPFPTFLPYEIATGQHISDALLDVISG